MDRMNKIGKAQKSHIYRSCNRFSKQETKIEQLEQDLKDTVDSKLEEALGNIFKNDKKIESEVQNVVKILRKSRQQQIEYEWQLTQHQQNANQFELEAEN